MPCCLQEVIKSKGSHTAVERGGGKGVQSTQARAPLGVRAVVKRNANRFHLSCVWCWFWYLDLLRELPSDMVIKIGEWLSLISKKRSPPFNRCVYECFCLAVHGAGNFSHKPSMEFSDFQYLLTLPDFQTLPRLCQKGSGIDVDTGTGLFSQRPWAFT